MSAGEGTWPAMIAMAIIFGVVVGLGLAFGR